jgi:carbon storage regulator CsrA
MLVLTRKPNDEVVMNVSGPCQIRFKLLSIDANRTRCGFEAPEDLVEILRGELIEPHREPVGCSD